MFNKYSMQNVTFALINQLYVLAEGSICSKDNMWLMVYESVSQSVSCCLGDKLMCNGNENGKLVPHESFKCDSVSMDKIYSAPSNFVAKICAQWLHNENTTCQKMVKSL